MADDSFVYFAYGSNMLTRRLRAADRAPSAHVESKGFVAGHRLTFDKVSKEKSGGRSGKCDMERTGNAADRVFGVVFNIAKADEKALDDVEGPGYRRHEVEVVTAVGPRWAVAYIVERAEKKDPSLRPYDWYKALVIAGAEEHGLPDEYVERLRAVESQPDPMPDRKTKREAEALLVGAGILIE